MPLHSTVISSGIMQLQCKYVGIHIIYVPTYTIITSQCSKVFSFIGKLGYQEVDELVDVVLAKPSSLEEYYLVVVMVVEGTVS